MDKAYFILSKQYAFSCFLLERESHKTEQVFYSDYKLYVI
jgi:hypothetical protein